MRSKHYSAPASTVESIFYSKFNTYDGARVESNYHTLHFVDDCPTSRAFIGSNFNMVEAPGTYNSEMFEIDDEGNDLWTPKTTKT